MKFFIKLVSLLFLFTIFISCRQNIDEPISPPIIPKEIEPGRRDYVWDETVLEVPAGERALLRGMWGASADDIWAVGDASLSQLGIWHYDGAVWKNGVSTPNWGQTCIWGTASDNIWMSNTDGLFWHFNGKIWEEPIQISVEGNAIHLIQRVWGLSANEIYAVGYAQPYYGSDLWKGIIFKYDGKAWNQISIQDIQLNFIHIRKAVNGDLIIYAWDEKTGELSFYTYNGKGLTKFFVTDGMLAALERIGDQLFFSAGQVIYEYKNNSYEVWKDLTGTEYYGSIFCYRSIKDIFTRTTDGKGIGHYNGSDFKVIYKLKGNILLVGAGSAFDKDIYFLVRDYDIMKIRILHGKLKE